MRRPHLAIPALSCVLAACAADPPPPAPPPVVTVAPAEPAPPPALPALVLIPGAEASPRRGSEVKTPEVEDLRAGGRRHVLRRTADGIVVISADRGVLGFVKDVGAPIRWVGFVEDDEVLVATRDALYRAKSPDDAVLGKLDTFDKIAPEATILASSGEIVVAAAPDPDGVYLESRNAGQSFKAGKRPAAGAIIDLAVRADGVIVAAVQKDWVKDEQGRTGLRAQIYTSKRAGAWTPGPVAETYYGSMLSQQGDSIVVQSRRKKGADLDTLGLDAGGRWIASDFPDSWLDLRWTSDRVSIRPPESRPGYPKPGRGGFGMLGGVMGGGTGDACAGVDCLAQRLLATTPPGVQAFQDGVCAKANVVAHAETFPVRDGKGKAEHDETSTTYSCDPKAPAERASTLVIRGATRRTARLPSFCASGQITGSARVSFVYCSAEHQGKPSILHVSSGGGISEVARGLPGDLEIRGSESASDGTTLIFAGAAGWLCSVAGDPACYAVPPARFLAARPLPGDRALVARRGGAHELDLELLGLLGQPLAPAVRVAVNDNLLEMEVTAEGNVRVWTSRTETWFRPSLGRDKREPPFDAFLVRADGQLVPDPAGKEAWVRETTSRAGK